MILKPKNKKNILLDEFTFYYLRKKRGGMCSFFCLVYLFTNRSDKCTITIIIITFKLSFCQSYSHLHFFLKKKMFFNILNDTYFHHGYFRETRTLEKSTLKKLKFWMKFIFNKLLLCN